MKLRTVIQIGADGKQASRVFAGLKEDANELDEAGERAALSFGGLADAASSVPGPLGAAAGFMSGPAGLVAGAGALGAALFKAANQAADAAVAVGELATLTDTSTEEASRLLGVFEQAGIESKDLSDIMLQTAGVLADDADLAEKLGVNIAEGATSATVFQEAVDAWSLTDELERGVLGAKLFGEEGVRQMSAVTTQVGDLGDALDAYDGTLFEQGDIDDALSYKQTMAELSTEFQDIAVAVGQSVLPALTDMASVFTDITKKAQELDDSVPDWLKTGLDWAELAVNPVRWVEEIADGIEEIETNLGGVDEATSAVEAATRKYWKSFDPAAGINSLLATTATKVDNVTSAIGASRTESNLWLQDLARMSAWQKVDEAIDAWAENVEEGSYDAQLAVAEWVGEMDSATAEPYVAELRAAFHEGDVEKVREIKKELSQAINTTLWITAKARNDLPGQGGPSSEVTWDQKSNDKPATGTVVNVTMHGQASSREMANAVAQWTANG